MADTKRPKAASRRVDRREWTRILANALGTARGRFGAGLTLLIVLIAVLGPRFTPYPPTAFTTAPYARPAAEHLLGGDNLGRDVLSRVLAGGWVLLLMAALATALGIALGAAAGIAAAYLRGFWDSAIMRTVDVVLAFPTIVFVLLLVSVAGPELWLIVLAVGGSHAPQVARVIRASTLEVSERDYVKAVQILGVRAWTVMRREVLPNLTSPLMVEIGIRLTYSIVIISGLSFLGFGEPPPAPNWGLMINENRLGLVANPWAVVVPATLIALLAIATNTFVDAVSRAALGIDRAAEQAGVVEGAMLLGDLQVFPLDRAPLVDSLHDENPGSGSRR